MDRIVESESSLIGIFISPHVLQIVSMGLGMCFKSLLSRQHVVYNDNLHLSVSMRSFRAENVSLLVKQLLDLDTMSAQETFEGIRDKYPIVITRDLIKGKAVA